MFLPDHKSQNALEIIKFAKKLLLPAPQKKTWILHFFTIIMIIKMSFRSLRNKSESWDS